MYYLWIKPIIPIIHKALYNWQTKLYIITFSRTFIVEAVRDLVADDDSDAAVVERLGEVLAVEVRLQDARGENFK